MNILGAAFSIRRPCYDEGSQAGEHRRGAAPPRESARVDEALDIAYEDVPTYLHAHHSMYMEAPTGLYYLTDVNDRYWRVQDTRRFNEKGHYIDCSPLVPTIAEFLELPYNDEGHTIKSVFAQATFYPSGGEKDVVEATQ